MLARLPSATLLGLLRTLKALVTWVEGLGPLGPWLFVGLFVAASLLMIWRLECLSERGFEGTVLGTLVMPYCSGLGNLIFVFVLGRTNGSGTEVMTNCLVNNVTNMTLLIGLPAIFWGMTIVPGKTGKNNSSAKKKKKSDETRRLNRLSLLLTLTAVLFFTGAVWALARDGKLDFGDGLVLVGLFLFWQCFHVFDVLKSNVRQNKSFSWMLLVDLALLGVGAYGVYISIDWLVEWISKIHTGFISAKYLGWLSGWLMVLPNGLLAMYYGWRRRADVVYTSQVGDGHICIPLCVGIFALYNAFAVPHFFEVGMWILVGTTLVHFLFLTIFGRLPRFMGWALVALYALFLYKGLIGNAT